MRRQGVISDWHDRQIVPGTRYDPSLGKRFDDTKPLFLSERTHARLTERELGYLIKKFAEKASVHDISPHDLQHRFGYRMAEVVPSIG